MNRSGGVRAGHSSAVASPARSGHPLRRSRRPAAFLSEVEIEAELLRGTKIEAFEERKQRSIPPIDFGSYPLDAQRPQVGEKLRQQRRPYSDISIIGIDADRIHDGRRLDTTELTEIDARHDEAHRSAVQFRHQRDRTSDSRSTSASLRSK